jgi:hypothetical protein
MGLLASFLLTGFSNASRAALAACACMRAQSMIPLAFIVVVFSRRGAEESVYNILWAVVFGFATLNILSLAAKHFEPGRRGLSFGELLAVLVVVISIFLLGWEMLSLFHIFPIKLKS